MRRYRYPLPRSYRPRYPYRYKRDGGGGAAIVITAAAAVMLAAGGARAAVTVTHHHAAAAPAPPSAAAPVPAPASANAALGQKMAAAYPYDWAGGQWSCLDWLWTRESGWRVVWNFQGSGAYGIPQSLPASKMAAAGADWQTNPATQIKWGLGYIAGTYGTPCRAWAHETSAGWY